MNTLFDIGPVFPDGFSYFPDFIDAEEEQNLLHHISRIHLPAFRYHGFEAKRKTASFGYDYHFDNNTLSRGKEIPDDFKPLIEKTAKYIHEQPANFAELLITEYPPGAVINWHRDAFPFDIIAGISLLSDCTFRLRPVDKEKQSKRSTISCVVRRRSLYIIRNAARMAWQHNIAPVDHTRFSITLRTLKSASDR
jgi:alkylated DNA repair dioxygenase AlkB